MRYRAIACAVVGILFVLIASALTVSTCFFIVTAPISVVVPNWESIVQTRLVLSSEGGPILFYGWSILFSILINGHFSIQ